MCFTLGVDTNFSTIIIRIPKAGGAVNHAIYFEKVIANAVYHFANENTWRQTSLGSLFLELSFVLDKLSLKRS